MNVSVFLKILFRIIQ